MMKIITFRLLTSCHHHKGNRKSLTSNHSRIFLLLNDHSLSYFSRENEMTVALSKELSGLIRAGDIDGLTITVAKWRLHYKDIRVENTPLLHLAVIGDHFQMVKFLISKGVDLHIIDQV